MSKCLEEMLRNPELTSAGISILNLHHDNCLIRRIASCRRLPGRCRPAPGVNARLNKGEARNALTRAVFFNRLRKCEIVALKTSVSMPGSHFDRPFQSLLISEVISEANCSARDLGFYAALMF